MNLKPIFVAGSLISWALAGCTPPANQLPFATGGSKTDATVTIAINSGEDGTPVYDWPKIAHDQALRHCEAWGYSKVQPFGGVVPHCISSGFLAVPAGSSFIGQQYCRNARYESIWQCS